MQSTLQITKEQYELTQELIHKSPKGHQLNRLRFIEYKYNGKTNKEIGELLGKCQQDTHKLDTQTTSRRSRRICIRRL